MLWRLNSKGKSEIAEQDNLRQQMAQERTVRQQSPQEKGLLEELQKIRASHQEFSSKCAADVSAARQEVERLQLDITRKMTAHTKNKNGQLVVNQQNLN